MSTCPNDAREKGLRIGDDDTSMHRNSTQEKSRRSVESETQRHPQDADPGSDDDVEVDGAHGPAAARAASRASSTRSRAVTIVPVSRRRGLLARFAFVIPEVERPYEYSNRTKWTITVIVALAGSASPLGSAIFYRESIPEQCAAILADRFRKATLPQIAEDLHTDLTVTNLTIAVYMLAMAIFPLWWSSFSETLGRRTIYVISFGLGLVFSILSAVSTSIGMLIAMRVLGGGASASVQAVGAGTISDIWEVRERGKAMGIFYLGPLMGPLLAPIIGGALSEKWGWRSTMWFLAIHAGLVFIMIFFCLPETLAKKRPEQAQPQPTEGDGNGERSELTRMTTRQSVAVKTKKTGRILKRFFVDPLSIILFLRFPPIAATVFIAAITFCALFILNITLQSAFSQPPYGYSQLYVGLLYIPSSIGYVISSLVGGRWIDYIMAREARRARRYDAEGRLVFLPEDRMRENAWLAVSMYPVALIGFGWAVERGVHWSVPSVMNLIFGISGMLIFSAATTMLTEFMPSKSSGGIAVNNFVRNIFSCLGTVVTEPLISRLGYGWLCTAVGIIALVFSASAVLSLRVFGPRWRRDMDLKLKK